MTKIHLLTALAAALALGSASAGPLDQTTGTVGVKANANVGTDAGADLSALDKDGDGKISKSEAAGNKALAKQFKKLDTNHDGSLDASEFAKFEAGGSAGGSSKSGSSDTPAEKPAKP